MRHRDQRQDIFQEFGCNIGQKTFENIGKTHRALDDELISSICRCWRPSRAWRPPWRRSWPERDSPQWIGWVDGIGWVDKLSRCIFRCFCFQFWERQCFFLVLSFHGRFSLWIFAVFPMRNTKTGNAGRGRAAGFLRERFQRQQGTRFVRGVESGRRLWKKYTFVAGITRKQS